MSWLRPAGEGVEIDVLVVPRSSRDRIVGVHADRLKVQITAPPVDGAANDALVRLLAATFGVARRAVEIRRGATGRRKRAYVDGIDERAARHALREHGVAVGLLAALSLFASACEPASVEVDVQLVLPADTTTLARTDNVSVVVSPDGPTVTESVPGLDFALDLALEPGDTSQDVAVYLAEGTDLLAWGRSVRVVLADTPALGVLVGPPGALAAMAATPKVADPAARASRLQGFGALVVDEGGASWAVDHVTYDVYPAARAPFAPEEVADLRLVPDALGGAIALRFDATPAYHRYDPAADAWATVEPGGLDLLAERDGAAVLPTDDGATAFVFGGGSRVDVVAVPLVPGDAFAIATVADLVLPDPRRGAVATWARGPAAGDDRAVLVGTDADAPVVWVQGAAAAGPTGPWTGLACAPSDPIAVEPDWPVTILCLGGIRNGAPTADGLSIRVGADGPPEVTEHPDLLPAPMEAPLALLDAEATYVHGEGRLVRFDRGTLEPQTVQDGLSRQGGGTSVTLATGTTLVVGGRASEGASVSTWETFTPQPSGD